ncbi:MAG: FHA domain-containing protein [Myxococcota bacterium]|jgi:hypothetical protein
MSERTTVVRMSDLAPRRAELGNEGTRVGAPSNDAGPPGILFDTVAPELAEQLLRYPEPGVALFVVGPRGVIGHSWSATTDDYRTVCLGRHSFCNFSLTENMFVSLRHLLLVVGRRIDPWRARVIDLSTEWGFSDEAGRQHRSVAFERLAVLGVPGHWIYAFETGGPLPWNPKSFMPYDTLPPRAYQSANSDERARVRRPRAVESSQVTSFPGPVSFTSRELVAPGEAPVGALVVRGPTGAARLPVGLRALERGVLVGRDPRCGRLGFTLPDSVSRVHALVLALDGEVFIADTGSSNGVWESGHAVRIAPMLSGGVFHLGADAEVQWTAAH